MNISDNYNDMATAIQWFYDKQATITKNTNSYDDTTGLYSRAETETITVNCNVQPLDKQGLYYRKNNRLGLLLHRLY